MSVALEVNNLHKTLGKREIIKGISFSVNEGEIFGFLGPNGAGKTTTIKMIVGLISPSSGSIKIAGSDISSNRETALSNVGAIVENPELYSYLTGRQNLDQLARIYGNISKKDIDDISELVGLKDRIDDKVKKYSLGMKQRLGLAQALIAKPKLLILDEPTNGLDPSGIIELRNIIKTAAKETKTAVFVSSHILSEIENLCDTVAFIDKGIIKAIEPINGSDSVATDKSETTEHVVIITSDKDSCMKHLVSLNIKAKLNNEEIIIDVPQGSVPELVFSLAKENIHIEEIYKKQAILEERYLEIVQGGTK